ncbi:HET-domain-containing protein [Hyaloscypha variabilis F]|uniref:HET-domain-containing protein n=1 Tax=Hyaloscypha variabilis (strain UAMH 11265 / GT02V1 / F) TaxID=1149755 RepID=A0A2J6S1U1_HYAVF|nr:HET-domain-containing protein [Hyaloscypha variabilis F]
MAEYENLPLSADVGSFRLLEFGPNSDGPNGDETTIDIKLANYDCHNAPEYEALSYTWSSHHDGLAMIKLNGHSISVTKNLFHALKQVRLNQVENCKSESRLWVDAICINQRDDAEKSRQVLLMRDIYANASRVITWIGQPDNLSDLAFDTLEHFAADDGTLDASPTYQGILDIADKRRAAIKLLIERSYFERVWVIQEVLVAKRATIFCGSLSMAFDKFYLAVERMTGSGFYPLSAATKNITYLGDWRNYYLEMATPGRREEREEMLGLSLFMDARDRKATNLRDKIYSLRAIAHEDLASGIKVDYSHDNSVERVYTDFTKLVLNICPDLRILSAVIGRHRMNTTLLLPSWVPDWSQPKYGGGMLNRYLYRFSPESLFRAGGPGKPRVTIAEDSDTLFLEGVRLDTVSRVIPIKSMLMAKDESCTVTEAILQKLAGQLVSLENYPFTGEPFWIAFFRTLTADRTALSPRIREDYRAKFMITSIDWKLNHEDVEQNLAAKAWAEVSKGIATIIEDKDMFLTERGYLGLGHEGFQIGDVVCVFTGGEVPFLLRKSDTPRGEMFSLLSECYIHGVMDGEAMQSPQSKRMECFEIE